MVDHKVPFSYLLCWLVFGIVRIEFKSWKCHRNYCIKMSRKCVLYTRICLLYFSVIHFSRSSTCINSKIYFFETNKWVCFLNVTDGCISRYSLCVIWGALASISSSEQPHEGYLKWYYHISIHQEALNLTVSVSSSPVLHWDTLECSFSSTSCS